jgi:hypothetical protein
MASYHMPSFPLVHLKALPKAPPLGAEAVAEGMAGRTVTEGTARGVATAIGGTTERIAELIGWETAG